MSNSGSPHLSLGAVQVVHINLAILLLLPRMTVRLINRSSTELCLWHNPVFYRAVFRAVFSLTVLPGLLFVLIDFFLVLLSMANKDSFIHSFNFFFRAMMTAGGDSGPPSSNWSSSAIPAYVGHSHNRTLVGSHTRSRWLCITFRSHFGNPLSILLTTPQYLWKV